MTDPNPPDGDPPTYDDENVSERPPLPQRKRSYSQAFAPPESPYPTSDEFWYNVYNSMQPSMQIPHSHREFGPFVRRESPEPPQAFVRTEGPGPRCSTHGTPARLPTVMVRYPDYDRYLLLTCPRSRSTGRGWEAQCKPHHVPIPCTGTRTPR
ncbi:hypothetical protein DENSPDRAFT_494539 [Dentipellis sp. KUC8613]|nr:hypothetical protein DENSPDRAFT_494539 [Dentipellis sp. KUC8613]